MIAVSCPSCNNSISAPDNAAGRRMKCHGCQSVITIPVDDLGIDLDAAATPANGSRASHQPDIEPIVRPDIGQQARELAMSSGVHFFLYILAAVALVACFASPATVLGPTLMILAIGGLVLGRLHEIALFLQLQDRYSAKAAANRRVSRSQAG